MNKNYEKSPYFRPPNVGDSFNMPGSKKRTRNAAPSEGLLNQSKLEEMYISIKGVNSIILEIND